MAVFLTSVDILDTGFLKVGRTTPANRGTTQASTAKRVNSGSALRLKGVTMELTSSVNIDKSSVAGKFNIDGSGTPQPYQGVQAAAISSNPTTFTLSILLNSNNDSTSNVWGINDMALLNDLLNLPHTPWFKAIYYPVDITTVSGDRGMTKQMIHYLGTKDTTQDQGDINISLWTGSTSTSGKDLTDVNYIACRFESVTMTQAPKNMIEVKLEGVITT